MTAASAPLIGRDSPPRMRITIPVTVKTAAALDMPRTSALVVVSRRLDDRYRATSSARAVIACDLQVVGWATLRSAGLSRY